MCKLDKLIENSGSLTIQKINEFKDEHFGSHQYDYYLENTIDYLNEAQNFRTFSLGLTDFMKKKYNYIEDENLEPKNKIKERAKFLSNILNKKNIDIHYETLKNWFSDKTRPDFKNRENMFKLCFALELDVDESVEFFHKVCFDRPANVRVLDELVYYFCLLNKLTYQDALKLKEEMYEIVESSEINYEKETIHTSTLKNRLDELIYVEDLRYFVSENKVNFLKRNVSAIAVFNELLELVKGKSSDKKYIKNKKDRDGSIKKRLINEDVKEELGLVIQDFLEMQDLGEYDEDNILYQLEDMDLASVDFMINIILHKVSSNRKISPQHIFSKESNLPKIIRTNFPSKKSFSDLIKASKDPQNLRKSNYSYDALRKIIILLKFYSFWFIAQRKKIEDDSMIEIFIDELNDTLLTACLPPIYMRNPYDWMFLYCSSNDKPLKTFRSLLFDTTKNDDEN